MKKWIIVALIGSLLAGWYYLSRPRFDFKAIADRSVEDDWLVNLKQVDALQFLDGGGHFADVEPVNNLNMDKTVVRPLIERLQQDAGLKFMALIDQLPDQAFIMAARLPEDRERLQLVKRIVKEEDEAFSGIILRQYGYRWMYFRVLDKETAIQMHAEEVIEE